MAKTESTFVNMVVTLFVVTFVCSSALAYVYEVTKGPKAAAELAKKINAIKNVVPAFNNDPVKESTQIKTDMGVLVLYPAKFNGQLVGTAIETWTHQGYGGTIKLIVGLLPDGTIYNISVIEHKETPGLGDKMESQKSNFIQQFKGKNLAHFKLSPKKDGGDVDAITAATVSTRAFCDAVRRAYVNYEKETIH